MKRTVFILLFSFCALLLSAGDLAVLENLGFSPDGKYFMFGQHVFETNSGQAYAEAAVVDVARNQYVSNGWMKRSWNIRMLPNQDSRGALYELLSQALTLKKRYRINHLEQGRMLYTIGAADRTLLTTIEGNESPGLSFRDFERGREFFLILQQSSNGSGDNSSASFFIDLRVMESSGLTSEYRIGRPGFLRKNVTSYSIARVWIGPNGKSLVIAVAKESPDLSVHYMVETLTIN